MTRLPPLLPRFLLSRTHSHAEFKANGLGDVVTVTQRDIEENGFPEEQHGKADGVFLDLPKPYKVCMHTCGQADGQALGQACTQAGRVGGCAAAVWSVRPMWAYRWCSGGSGKVHREQVIQELPAKRIITLPTLALRAGSPSPHTTAI